MKICKSCGKNSTKLEENRCIDCFNLKLCLRCNQRDKSRNRDICFICYKKQKFYEISEPNDTEYDILLKETENLDFTPFIKNNSYNYEIENGGKEPFHNWEKYCSEEDAHKYLEILEEYWENLGKEFIGLDLYDSDILSIKHLSWNSSTGPNGKESILYTIRMSHNNVNYEYVREDLECIDNVSKLNEEFKQILI